MVRNFYYPRGYMQISKIFLTPLINIPYPNNTYIKIKSNTIEIPDIFVAVYEDFQSLNIVNFEYNITNINGYICKILEDNKIYFFFDINKLNEDFKETYNNIVFATNNEIYSKYSAIPLHCKKKILNYYNRYYKDSDADYMLALTTRFLFPHNHTSGLGIFLSSHEKDYNIINTIIQMREFGYKIDINKETLELSDENISIIQNRLKTREIENSII